MSLPTATQYGTQLSNLEYTLQTASKALTEAHNQYRIANDPTVYLTDAERLVRQAKALPALEQAEQEAAKAVDDALTLASDVVQLTTDAKPSLSPEDESRAASRLPFVKDDIDRLTVRELATQIRRAALENDRISLYLYLRFAPDRLKVSGNGTPQHDEGDVPWDAMDNDADARQALSHVLDDVREMFRSPELARLRDKAVGLRATAFDVDNVVRSRARQNGSYAFQTANEVSW